MNMDNVKKKAKEISREFILINIGVVLLGLLLVIFPTESTELICSATGIAMCIWGVFKIFDYIRLKKNEIFGSFALVQGCALLAFGVYFIITPKFLASFITAALSIVLFIGAVLKLQYALEFAHLNSRGWTVQAVGAIIMIAASVVAFANPFGAANLLMIFLGASLIVDGVWDLITMFYVSKILKNVKNTVKETRKSRNKKSDTKQYVDAEFVDEDEE